MTEQVGRVVGGRYRLLSPLGAGASAEVFLADDVRLRRRVAVKVLHAALADDDAFLRRFRSEARAAAALSHPNIVAVYDWNGDEVPPYIVTEHLGGGSLRDMLDGGHRLTPSQALLVGLQAARALDHAHSQGFVHRDIKPANMLFGADGRLRIADFGLARAIAEAGWTEPSGSVVGTARYSSPEQARGEPLDGKSDVYSLALVLIEAVTGEVPFTTDTTIGTLMARLDRPVETPEELSALRGVLDAAGGLAAPDRPEAGEVARHLMAAANGLPRPARLPLVVRADGAPAAASPASAASPQVDDDHGDHTTRIEPPTDQTMVQAAPAPQDTTVAQPLQAPGGALPVTGTVPQIGGDHGRGPDATQHFAQPPPSGPQAVPDGSGGAGGGRRWLLRILAVLSAIALGVAAAWVFWLVRRPTHVVPEALIGADQAEITNIVGEFRWRIDTREEFREGTEEGEVLETDPAPGAELREGETLVVVVSQGPPLVELPDEEQLRGMSQEEAEGVLTGPGIGLVPEFVETPSDEVEDGQVIGYADDTPERLAQGSTVTVEVSNGDAGPTIPDVTGWDYDDARDALRDMGYDVDRENEASDTYDDGQVIRTEPGVGESAEDGGTVVVVVSRGGSGGDDDDGGGEGGGQVEVPDVSGMSLGEASEELQDAGLTVGNAWGSDSGQVVNTLPGGGTPVAEGSRVDLFLF